MKKLSLTILIAFTLLLAGMAAYFSVFGLSKLFIAPILIIFFGVLELGKIVAITLLNQFSKIFPKLLNIVFLLFVGALMIATALGVWGYLSSKYTETSLRIGKNEGQIELFQKKDTLFKLEKIRYENVIKTKSERIKTLSELNLKQETRIDSMYNRGQYKNATKIENITAKTTENILNLNKDIDEANGKIKSLDDSIAKYDIQILELQNSDIARDLGPLKYVAQSLNISMDKLVNFLILLFILVSDPMAVALVIAINILVKNKENKPVEENKKENKFLNFFKRKKKEKIIKNETPKTTIKFEEFNLKEANKRHFENIINEGKINEEIIVEKEIPSEVTETEEIIEEEIKEKEIIEEIKEKEIIEEIKEEEVKEIVEEIKEEVIEIPEIIEPIEPIEISVPTENYIESIDAISEHIEEVIEKENIEEPIKKEIIDEIPFPNEELINENKQEIFIEDLLFEEPIQKTLEVKSNIEEMEKLSNIKDNLEEALVLENVLPEKKTFMEEDFWEDDDIKKDDEDFWKDSNLTNPIKKDEDFWNI